MLKWISYILIFFVSLSTLAPNFQGSQFLKIPYFLEHYNFYKENSSDNETSFWSFIKEHYLKQIDVNKEGHDELPFKSNIHNFIPISIEYFQLVTIVEYLDSYIEIEEFNYYSNFFKSINLFSIWNPPRI